MRRVVLAALAVLVIAACSASHTPAPRDALPPFHAQAFYEALEVDAESFTLSHGEWVESLGDAPFYGLAFYAHVGHDAHYPAWEARAEEARTRALSLVTNADFGGGDLQQMVMSSLGLIDAMDARGDRADLPAVDDFVDRIDRLMSLLGWYVDSVGQKSWALQTYGPTSISALVALMNTQYAYLLGGDKAEGRTQWAVDMASHVADHAWNGSYYDFGAGRAGLFLYPNVAMIALHARLFELTHDEAHRTRAVALYDAVQPLKLPDGRYYSGYDADAFGAKTRDFSTLSEHNYLMLALMLLYEITGSAKYATEMDALLDTLAEKLHGPWCLSNVHAEVCAPACQAPGVCVVDACEADACHQGLLHHWIDGRAAIPTDATFFCSGCNLQALYVMWYRQVRLSRAARP